ncbi:hypothetical protein EDB86DRAFT_2828280 [Lactarius hatsudake]|nr:hypothetical protein EDB86DRAFT_2828280 [Lactarius hatsudake]
MVSLFAIRPHPCVQRALISATVLIAYPGFLPPLHSPIFSYTPLSATSGRVKRFNVFSDFGAEMSVSSSPDGSFASGMSIRVRKDSEKGVKIGEEGQSPEFAETFWIAHAHSRNGVKIGEEGQSPEFAETYERLTADLLRSPDTIWCNTSIRDERCSPLLTFQCLCIQIAILFSLAICAACIPAAVFIRPRLCLSRACEVFCLPAIYRWFASSHVRPPGPSGSAKEVACVCIKQIRQTRFYKCILVPITTTYHDYWAEHLLVRPAWALLDATSTE